MTASNCQIRLSGHFNEQSFTTLPCCRCRVSFQSQGQREWLPPRDISFCSLDKNIAAMYLKIPVYVIIVVSFLNQPKTSSKSYILRILDENLEFCLFSSKIHKIQFLVTLCHKNLIVTSNEGLLVHFGINGKRRLIHILQYQILRIGGFTAKNLGKGGNIPPLWLRQTRVTSNKEGCYNPSLDFRN